MRTDERLVIAAAAEIKSVEQPLQINLEAASVLQLVAVLQLAIRHPQLPSSARSAAVAVIEGARAYFAAVGAIHTVALIERGNDPAYDVAGPHVSTQRH